MNVPGGSSGALITALISLTTGGGLLALVSAYRQYKQGKIGDADTMLKRYDTENLRLQERAQRAESELVTARKQAYLWEEQAMRYRVQLIKAGATPIDLPSLESSRGNRDDQPS